VDSTPCVGELDDLYGCWPGFGGVGAAAWHTVQKECSQVRLWSSWANLKARCRGSGWIGRSGGQPGSRIRRAINEAGSSRFVEWTFKTSMLIHANDVVDSWIVGLSLCTLACPPLPRRASACLCLDSACFAGRGRPGTGVRGLRCFVGENAPPSSQSSSDTVMAENPSTGLIICALMAHRDAVIEANTAAS